MVEDRQMRACGKRRERLIGEKHGHETLENQCALATGLLNRLPTGFSAGCLKIHFNDLLPSLPLLWSHMTTAETPAFSSSHPELPSPMAEISPFASMSHDRAGLSGLDVEASNIQSHIQLPQQNECCLPMGWLRSYRAGLPLPNVPFGTGEKIKTQVGSGRRDMGVGEIGAAKSLGLREINGSHAVQSCQVCLPGAHFH